MKKIKKVKTPYIYPYLTIGMESNTQALSSGATDLFDEFINATDDSEAMLNANNAEVVYIFKLQLVRTIKKTIEIRDEK